MLLGVARRAKSDDSPKMQATLIRFGPELFLELKEEARAAGISVAQYVREAVVARMAYTAGLRRDARYMAAEDGGPTNQLRTAAGLARADAARVRSESSAVRAESAQAKEHARHVQQRSGDGSRTPR
jgi:hypothetical protein